MPVGVDSTRKRKLLDKLKEGKKEDAARSSIPQEAFIAALKVDV